MPSNFRYPGPRPFGEADEPLFHGRRREVRELFDLVAAHGLVVLFAKSGTGKTSLVQAGLVPRLRRSPIVPFLARLNRVGQPLTAQLLEKVSPGAPPGALLWEALVGLNRAQRGTPLIIIDQFEEVFTLYNEAERADFISQLADVANGFLPEKIRDQIRAGLADGSLSDAAAAAMEQPPRAKFVFSIRSDLLHWLHEISDELPSILRNRFELLGLGPEAAREAIEKPAAEPREVGGFASPSFAWSGEAVAEILSFLGKKQAGARGRGAEVEAFQLQLVCRHVEQKVAAEGQGGVVVGPGFYGGEAGIEAVLGSFYEKTLLKIADPVARAVAQRLVEDRLVVNGRRVSVDGETIARAHGVAPEVLSLLVEERLLRRDSRETGDYFEISHDALLPPILRQKEGNDRAEADRAAREAEARARAEAQKRRRAVAVAVGAVCLAGVAVAASFFAWGQYREAERARAEVFRNALGAQRSLARVLKVEGRYPEATGLLDKILAYPDDLPAPLRDSIARDRADWQSVAGQVASARLFLEKGALREAVTAYETALRTSPDARLEQLARQAAADLDARFDDLLFKADRQARAGQNELAKENLRAALRLKPGDATASARLRGLGG